MEENKSDEVKFQEEFNKLCKKYNMEIIASPVFVPTHGGAFVVSAQVIIRKVQNAT